MSFQLQKLPQYEGAQGPVLFIIMDGVGLYRGNSDGYPGNAVDIVQPQHLMHLMATARVTREDALGDHHNLFRITSFGTDLRFAET